MRNAFPEYYAPTDFSSLWTDATFILDTNILLNLYRYPTKARDETLAILEKIKERLWVPFHVGLEYQQNRLTVISEQNSDFHKAGNNLVNIEKALSELSIFKKKHSSIDPTSFTKTVEKAITSFRKELKILQDKQTQVHNDDAIREKIDNLLDGRVGGSPESDEVLQWQKAGERRYSLSVPPGYEDRDKLKDPKNVFEFGGIEYNRAFGDLIIWKQILKFCKTDEISKVIFVTADEKEDWWLRVEGRTIGPRPELREEIRREASVSEFYIYNPESFLEHAEKQLGAKVTTSSINQVREISAQNAQRSRRRSLLYNKPALDLTHDWLISAFDVGQPGRIFSRQSSQFHYGGQRYKVEYCDIRYLEDLDRCLTYVYDYLGRAMETYKAGNGVGTFLFVVSDNIDRLMDVVGRTRAVIKASPVIPLRVFFGVINPEEFEEGFILMQDSLSF